MVAMETLKIKDEEQLMLELESFTDAIRGRTRPVVNGEDGREAIGLGPGDTGRQMAQHRQRGPRGVKKAGL